MPGGAVTHSIDCAPPKLTGRQYFVAHFIPAWQVIEVEWFKTKEAEASPQLGKNYQRMRFPVARVKRFE